MGDRALATGAPEMPYTEWVELGERLYGSDPKKWEFRCVRCGHVQSAETMATATGMDVDETRHRVFMSCVGRWRRDLGCDWTLGGLFQIQKRTVVGPEGERVPVFLFAAETEAPEPRPAAPSTPLPTWFCWIPKLGGDLATGRGALVRAATRSKARYLCYLEARDSFPDLSITEIRVRRERAYDAATFRNGCAPRYAEVAS